MAIVLQKVPYDINSKHGSVQACLSKKKDAVANLNGIGPESCCSFLYYLKANSDVDNVWGNSRIRVPYKVIGVQDVGTACVHGELTALWNLIQELDGIPPILEMYIEMSPCEKCLAALNNILPNGQQVLYSFDHPAQVDQWKIAAKNLCK